MAPIVLSDNGLKVSSLHRGLFRFKTPAVSAELKRMRRVVACIVETHPYEGTQWGSPVWDPLQVNIEIGAC